MEWHSVLLSAVGSQKGSNPYPSHFFGKKILFTLDVCVGAHVCMETANIDPNSCLFVGEIVKVIDIVYDKSVGPKLFEMAVAKRKLPYERVKVSLRTTCQW